MRPCEKKMHFGFGEAYPPDLAHLTSDGKHHGEDYLCTTGTKIIACVDGVYYKKGYYGGFGFSVWIKFWSGWLWRRKTYRIILAHLITVYDNWKTGDKINKTDIIGLSGASGSATYFNPDTKKTESHPHLHLEIQELQKDGSWSAVNPKFVTGV